MTSLPYKYKLRVVSSLGLVVRARPAPASQGAGKVRSLAEGDVVHATDIQLYDGVPYATLVPTNPSKPEFIRVAEAGGVTINESGRVFHLPNVMTYARVIEQYTTEDKTPAPSDAQSLIGYLKELHDFAVTQGFKGKFPTF